MIWVGIGLTILCVAFLVGMALRHSHVTERRIHKQLAYIDWLRENNASNDDIADAWDILTDMEMEE